MRSFLTLLAFFFSYSSFAQQTDSSAKTSGTVSFITKIDLKQVTKDGIYVNGYVVNIAYGKAKALDGKTVRIKGKVTIVEGNKYYTDGEIRQGRSENTKHILNPRIKIVSD